VSDPRTDRIGKQTRNCLFSGARREFTSRHGELKNATMTFFNTLLVLQPSTPYGLKITPYDLNGSRPLFRLARRSRFTPLGVLGVLGGSNQVSLRFAAGGAEDDEMPQPRAACGA
jgi:hypothetical protein